MTKLIDLMYNYSGYRISPPLDLYITDSNISWLATVPEGTTLTIEVSVDEGETWLTCTNNESIPGVQSGVQKLLIKQTLTTNDLDISPQLHSLTIQIGSVGWALEANEWRQDSLIILVDELSDRYIPAMPVEYIDPIIVHLVEEKFIQVSTSGADPPIVDLEDSSNLVVNISSQDFLAVSLLDPVPVPDKDLTSFDSLSIKAKELILLLPENQVRELGSVFVNNIDLSFLGVTVTRETVVDIVPNKKDRRVSIPGKHGEIVIPGRLSSRMIQLALHIEAEDTNLLGMMKEELFKLFDPSNGWLELRFTLKPERIYYCRYSGQASLQEWIIDSDIVIPLKMFDPYIYNYQIKELVGNGTIQNEGQVATPIIIEIAGPATKPIVNIGNKQLTYTKNLAGGEKLIIDGKTMKVTKGIENALPDLSGGLEALLIPPGATSVSCSSGTAKFKWQERWEI